MEGLESISGKADAAGRVPKALGISNRPWPIKGSLDIDSNSSEAVMPSNDLLITGHENGVVEFWRLAAGGCARRVFSLFTGSLFEGEFGPDALGVSDSFGIPFINQSLLSDLPNDLVGLTRC